MKFLFQPGPGYIAVLAALCAAPLAQAQSPLRGNPVDALPPLQRPAGTRQPPPHLEVQTPAQNELATRMAQRIVPRNFDVTGVHSLPFEKISALLAPLAGKEISVAELVQQVDQITALYRNHGYILSFALVQNQNFANGLVVITVVEGYVGSVRIEGDIGHAADRLETLAAPLKAERPLTQATLERALNLMRLVPGLKLAPSLDLPNRADGASELLLKASRRPLDVTANVANLGTGTQPLVNAALNSLTPLGEQVKLTSSVPLSTDDVTYFAAEARIPLGANGLELKLDAHHYEAKPKDAVLQMLGLDRKVTNDRISAGLGYPLLLSNARLLHGTIRLYGVKEQDRYDFYASDRWFKQEAQTRVASAELHYVALTGMGTSDATVEIAKGFDAMGAEKSITSNDGFSGVPTLDLDFVRANLNARQVIQLPAKFSLTLAGAAQYSNNTLPSSEQISFGSWRYAMGYPQGEQSGDKGVGLSFEANRLFGIGTQYLATVQPYALVDYARAWHNNPALQALDGRHLSSIALGIRFSDQKYYLLDFNTAKPVGARTVSGNDHNWRFNANYTLYYNAF